MGPGQICDFRSSSRLCVRVGVGGCLGGGEAGSCFPFILKGRGSPPCPSPTCLELQSPPLQCWWTGNRRWWEVGIEGDPQKIFWLVLGRSGRPPNLHPRKAHLYAGLFTVLPGGRGGPEGPLAGCGARTFMPPPAPCLGVSWAAPRSRAINSVGPC